MCWALCFLGEIQASTEQYRISVCYIQQLLAGMEATDNLTNVLIQKIVYEKSVTKIKIIFNA